MPSDALPLESLRVLAACVRHGNFSRAADALCLTPSAVSLRMRSLESQLGVALFVRNGPRLAVTEAGRLLAGQVEATLAALQDALDQCRNTKPPLRVTAAPTFASRWLVPRLPSYQSQPEAQPIELDATDILRPGDAFDVAIRSGTGPWPGFTAVELFSDTGTPMLSPTLAGTERMTPERLLALPLMRDARWKTWFELAGLPDAVPRFSTARFATYELEAIAAAEGVGVALLSPVLYADSCRRGELIAPFDACVEGPNRYWALWRADAAALPFVRWLQRELAADAASTRCASA